ncbi:histidine kinase N-terminal 7TM domain-containing protein [Phenylobacterium sp.]|uniref:histidine kinase N-terminal 7TM domain-containing protein n=1 Tax=Phenylobacterium sp. TaxID=1871053 RepID=UPI0011F6ED7A|nr:histidine kinase N-terminal 7TM domain-containing protein [Phenylobacterium sp.]THD67085.1 MAG: hypothetical protein E8A12_05795 [Phenylobacterium sp.]
MAAPEHLPARRPLGARLWRACAYFYILLALFSTAMYVRTSMLAPSTYGGVASASLGADLIRTTDPGRIDVWVRGLRAGSPLAQAGVHEGDRLRLDIRWNDFRALETGETFGFTRVAPGQPQHLALIVPEYQGVSRSVGNYRFAITLFDLGLGLMLFFRRRGDFAVEALGMAFVVSTITSNFPSPPAWSIFWTTVAYSGVALVPFLILAFALSFYDSNSRPVTRVEKLGYGALIAGLAAEFALAFYSNAFAYTSPLIRANVVLLIIEESFAYAATVYYFARGYAGASGFLRARYGLLLIALFLTFSLSAVQTYSFLVLKLARMDPENPLYDVNVVLSLIGPLLFAYAVLRHRVVDLGFVLNRTLVYGAVSLIMLTAFGLVEWAVEHVLKPSGRNESALLDAVIAVSVYLTFHRVRDFVERHLEMVFFRRWHDNEKHLRQLVEEASFITRPDRLRSAFVAELVRFTGGAACGLYLLEADGRYRGYSPADSFPPVLDPDEPLLVAMRAQRREIFAPGTATAIPAALALPMLQRNGLLGGVLLGPKPGGEAYRPDEIEVLAFAARQVGLDLHALRIDRLERESARAVEKLRKLEFENGLLRHMRDA